MRILPALVLVATISAFIYEKPVISPLSDTTRVVWATEKRVGSPQPTPTPEASIEPSIREHGESTSRTDAIIQEIQKVWGKEGHAEVAKAIAISYCESKWNERAYNHNTNGSEDFGIFQVNSIHKPTKDEMGNYQANIKKAKEIYDRAGKSWNPWACKKVIGL